MQYSKDAFYGHNDSGGHANAGEYDCPVLFLHEYLVDDD